MKRFKLGNTGIGIVGALTILAAVTGTAMVVFKRSSLLLLTSSRDVKDLRLVPIKQKLTRMGGYFVANNFVLCGQRAWSNGNPGNTCQWNDKTYSGDPNSFNSESFGLTNDVGLTDKNKLKFEIDIEKLFKDKAERSVLTGKNSWIQFNLVHQDDLDSSAFDSKVRKSEFDQDKYYVALEGSIEFKDEQGNPKSESFKSYYKRPIAIPEVEVKTSECVQRCDVSLTENPTPGCRSAFYMDKDTMTQVTATTLNNGPGVIYNLVYDRALTLDANDTTVQSVGNEGIVDVSVKDFIRAGEKYEWSDSFPCVTENVTIDKKCDAKTGCTETDVSVTSILEDEIMGTLIALASPLLPEKAQAYWVTVTTQAAYSYETSSSTSATTIAPIDQHAKDIGSLSYGLSPAMASAKSLIEPKRVALPIKLAESTFAGQKETTTTTTTTTYQTVSVPAVTKQVWVSPPH